MIEKMENGKQNAILDYLFRPLHYSRAIHHSFAIAHIKFASSFGFILLDHFIRPSLIKKI